MLTLENAESPDPAADIDPDLIRILIRDFKAGIVERLFGRGDREIDEIIHLLQLFFLDEIERVESFGFGGKADSVLRCIEACEVIDTVATGDRSRPRLLGSIAALTDQTDAANDDSLLDHFVAHNCLLLYYGGSKNKSVTHVTHLFSSREAGSEDYFLCSSI